MGTVARRALAGVIAAGAAAACVRAPAPQSRLGDLRPRVVDGPPRTFLAVELIREAHVGGLSSSVTVSACRWYVSASGALVGDHWGWCEDFQILPQGSPGYLLLTTVFFGDMSGSFSKMVVLPPLPAAVPAYGRQFALAGSGRTLHVEYGGIATEVAAGSPATLNSELTIVEPPPDTGHFEPGFSQPVPADVTYRVANYGLLDSRNIAGRGTQG